MLDCTASGTKPGEPSSILNAGWRSAAGAVSGAVLFFSFSCIGAALRWKFARIDRVLGQEFVQEIADAGDAAAVGPAGARGGGVGGAPGAGGVGGAAAPERGVSGAE